jgi:p21-activated kinase 1
MTLYSIHDLVGVGSTASVFHGVALNGEHVAIKKLRLNGSQWAGSTLQRVYSELSIMKDCDPSNIVRYYNSYLRSDEVWLVMEYINGMSVEHLVMEPPFRIESEDQIALVTRETIQAINYIHQMGFIHRDIKSANILISQQGEVKITDFGLSTPQNSDTNSALMGTVCYMAPEVALRDSGCNQALDVWSLGVTIFEMFKGVPPLFDMDPEEALHTLRRKDKPQIPGGFFVSDEIRDILQRCLDVDYTARASAADLLSHPFLTYACSPDKLGAYVIMAMHSRCTRED